MSLLMDALKRAEEAKRAADEKGSVSASAPSLSLTDDNAAASTADSIAASTLAGASRLPDLAAHIESVDAELAAVTPQQPARPRAGAATARPVRTETTFPGRSQPPAENERSAARNVFSAKQPAARKPATGLIIGLGVLGAIVIGGYFWWQLQRLSPPLQPIVASAPSAPAAPATPQPRQEPLPASPEGALPPAASGSPPRVPMDDGQPVAATSTPTVARATVTTTTIATSTPDAGNPAGTTTPKSVRTEATLSRPESESPVRLTRQPARNLTQLDQAYDALQAGRLEQAKRGYEQFLRNDAKNVDALLGLATIASHEGNQEAAQTFYVRAFEADPTNATAQAGMIQIISQADSAQAESQLKSALAAQPKATPLLVSLGNLYANQQRWSEAQETYFGAYTIEPENADIVFNLAVSLDHLHQNKLAGQYYLKALELTERQPARAVTFDRDQLRRRIQDLQP